MLRYVILYIFKRIIEKLGKYKNGGFHVQSETLILKDM